MKGFDFLNSLEMWKGKGGFSFHNLKKYCDFFNNPQNSPNIIHIAGTNGKGSASVVTAAIFSEINNRKVGLNISPHLSDIRERISINGQLISIEEFNSALCKILEAEKKLVDIKLSYHEAITLAYFLVVEKYDWSILEVGLGGRHDASNIVSLPKACIITSIGLDHQSVLGNTLSEIAYEKAGILKMNLEVLALGAMPTEALITILDIAQEKKVQKIGVYGRDFCGVVKNKIFSYLSEDISFHTKVNLQGEYQASNLACASYVALQLGISISSIIAGINKVKWPCRLEEFTLTNNKRLIIDGAHNEDGIDSLISFLDSDLTVKYYEREVVFGALATKDWRNMLKRLIKNSRRIVLFEPNSSMAVPLSEMVDFLSSFDINFKCYKRENLSELVDYLSDFKNKEISQIVVCGSLYLAGEFRNKLVGQFNSYW